MLPGVSVVLPTYQRVGLLTEILAPLLADPATAEIVVVVDGSTDGSRELLEDLAARHPVLRVLWQANAGAGAARQRGVEAARSGVVLLLDDDVLAGPGLVTGHATEHARQPGRVVLGSMPTRVAARRAREDVTTVLYARRYEVACREFLAHPDRILEGFWSGNVSMPRDLAAQIGLDDPELTDLFPSEDRELGLRLRAAGVEAAYCPELAAVHLHRRSLRRFLEDSRRQGRALHVLHDRYPEVVPSPTGPMLAGRLPPPVRWLVTGARSRGPVGAVAEPAIAAVVRALGVLRLWRAQDVAVVVLQRIAQARGARDGGRRG